MRPIRTIPSRQFFFSASPGPLICARCGEEYQRSRPGKAEGIWPGVHHVLDDGSGNVDEDLDRGCGRPVDYDDEHDHPSND